MACHLNLHQEKQSSAPVLWYHIQQFAFNVILLVLLIVGRTWKWWWAYKPASQPSGNFNSHLDLRLPWALSILLKQLLAELKSRNICGPQISCFLKCKFCEHSAVLRKAALTHTNCLELEGVWVQLLAVETQRLESTAFCFHLCNQTLIWFPPQKAPQGSLQKGALFATPTSHYSVRAVGEGQCGEIMSACPFEQFVLNPSRLL